MTELLLDLHGEYQDDWSCRECGEDSISSAEDVCPNCGSTWEEQN